jgi:hypothetical protein
MMGMRLPQLGNLIERCFATHFKNFRLDHIIYKQRESHISLFPDLEVLHVHLSFFLLSFCILFHNAPMISS